MPSEESPPGADQHLGSVVEELKRQLKAKNRELADAREQQSATAEILRAISNSPTDLQRVFADVAVSAARLCDAYDAAIVQRDGDVLRVVAHHGAIPVDHPGEAPLTHGTAMGRSVLERQTIHIADLQVETDEYPEGSDFARRLGHRTILAVPLIHAEEAIGALLIRRTEVRLFTDWQVDLLKTFADQAVIAIENTRLFDEVQARTRQLQETLEYQTATSEVLNVISRSPSDLQPVFEAIVASGLKLFPGAAVLISRPDGDFIKLAAVAASEPSRIENVKRTFPIPLARAYMNGIAILDRRMVDIPDGHSVPPELAPGARNFLASGNRAITIVPIMRGETAVGALNVVRLAPGPLSRPQLELLQTFADQAVIAIENARLFEEVRARNRDLTALSEVGRAVSSTLDLKMVLKTVVERAVELSGTDAGSIFYYRPESGRFELGETTGLDEEVIARFRKLDIAAGQTGLGEAISRREPLQVQDIMKRSSNALRDAALEAGLRAGLIVPLLGSEGALGALVLQRRNTGEFSPSVVSLMQSFADQSAIALENARLFEEIAKKSRELEIASQHKSQFVANMSHELRTPLAAVLGYAELMQEGFYEPQGPKSLDALTRIRSNGKHLLGLINTVLDIAKIESGQFSLNMAEYAIDSMVETVRAATESLAETKKLSLKTEVAKSLPIALGDEQRLTQVLLNLVGNAIKFTDAGEVRVTARATNDHFAVSVADTGPGIPEQERTRIFEHFHQVDSSLTKAKGGTGLGLAISKQIVEMHGGRIWVESTLGKGSTFQMELPTRAEFRKSAS